MTASRTPLPKGLRMIAAYRAERLSRRAAHTGMVQEGDACDLPGDAAKPPSSIVANPVLSGSVFATLQNTAAEAEWDTKTAAEPTNESTPSIDAVEIAPVSTRTSDLPLAELGFGPNMLIRLGQLGVHTVTDLARSDADQLRAELGEISRLLDVEAWINHAQQATRCN